MELQNEGNYFKKLNGLTFHVHKLAELPNTTAHHREEQSILYILNCFIIFFFVISQRRYGDSEGWFAGIL
jgi:hypothetical protein